MPTNTDSAALIINPKEPSFLRKTVYMISDDILAPLAKMEFNNNKTNIELVSPSFVTAAHGTF